MRICRTVPIRQSPRHWELRLPANRTSFSSDPTLVAAHLAAIVESSDDAIISKTLDGTVLTWNPSSERIFGYNAQEMIGASIYKLIPLELHPEENEVLARIARGEKVVRFETIRRRKDGTLFPKIGRASCRERV